MTREYYFGFLGFLNPELFEIYDTFDYQKEGFYKIKIRRKVLSKIFSKSPMKNCYYRFNDRFSLILPIKLEEYSKSGIPKDLEPFNNRNSDYPKYKDYTRPQSELYIDNDRIGLEFLY